MRKRTISRTDYIFTLPLTALAALSRMRAVDDELKRDRIHTRTHPKKHRQACANTTRVYMYTHHTHYMHYTHAQRHRTDRLHIHTTVHSFGGAVEDAGGR